MPNQKNTAGPDLTDFKRVNEELSLLSPSVYMRLSGVATTKGRKVDPQAVPFSTLDAIGYDEVVAWSEWVLLHMVEDPELYYLRAEGPKRNRTIAMHEAWLRPLLPKLLPVILRAFSYGVSAMVLKWDVGLDAWVEGESGKLRRTQFPGFAHYSRVHELWPGGVRVSRENDRLLSVCGPEGDEYGALDAEQLGNVRAFLPVWRGQFGRLSGQGTRRRQYDPWFDKSYHQLWGNRYLERSVDPVRYGYAPEGKITLPSGTVVSSASLLKSIMQSTKNGSSVSLPGTMQTGDGGKRAWELGTLEIPDRQGVFSSALTRDDLRIMRGGLSPAGLSGELDESLYFDFIQSICDFAAAELSQIVAVVHWLEHGVKSQPPLVIPNDIPKAKKRVLLELFKSTSKVTRVRDDGSVYTLAELVGDEIVEQLGAPSRTVEEAAHKPLAPAPGDPGRARDLASDREERRDDARTEEGENDTGGDDMDRQEQRQ